MHVMLPSLILWALSPVFLAGAEEYIAASEQPVDQSPTQLEHAGNRSLLLPYRSNYNYHHDPYNYHGGVRLDSSDYDCEAGYLRWRTGWSVNKKSWCCQHRGLGCANVNYPSTYPGAFPAAYQSVYPHGYHDLHDYYRRHGAMRLEAGTYDCEVGYTRWRTGWSGSKKSWCCQHRGLACPAVSYPNVYPGAFPKPYYETYPHGYQHHVIVHHHYDNPPVTQHPLVPSWHHHHEDHVTYVHHSHHAEDYDCHAGYAKWKTGWSVRKKDWCCQREGLGCPDIRYPDTHPDNGVRPPVGRPPPVPYDCKDGYENSKFSWSVAKKAYCCEHERRACPHDRVEHVTHITHQTFHDPSFDCNAGYDRWQTGWSVSKKRYCCDHAGRACGDYDCTNGLALWWKNWHHDKQLWCCAHKHIGCPTHPPTAERPTAPPIACNDGSPQDWSSDKRDYCCDKVGKGCHTIHYSEPYDCLAGLAQAKIGWSVGKKAWCCQHKGRGCQGEVSTSLPYDCEAGYVRWKTGWSVGKKQWCCDHRNRGCPENAPKPPLLGGGVSTTRGTPYDCQQDYSNWHDAWSVAKKAWCCENGGRGCPPSTSTSPPFDCAAGATNWKNGWSVGKKTWCCKHVHIGCASLQSEPPITSSPYDCNVGYARWQQGWSISKKQWCCKNKNKACVGSTTSSLPYDCSVQFGDWQTAWSIGKKQWCCDNTGRGCVVTTTPTQSRPYDCLAGYANWQQGWSIHKKEWCCANEDKACTNAAGHGSGEAFDCMEQFASWKTTWTQSKKAWCCQHRALGCAADATADAFDCQAGINNWQVEWNRGKQDWCCKHKGRGCKAAFADGAADTVGSVQDTTATAVVISCSSPPDDWEYTWSSSQKKHCHLKVYGCSFQVAHLLQWHAVKRHWCCENEGIGCRIGHHQSTVVARKYEQTVPVRLLHRLGGAYRAGQIGAAFVAIVTATLIVIRARSQRCRSDAAYLEVHPSRALS